MENDWPVKGSEAFLKISSLFSLKLPPGEQLSSQLSRWEFNWEWGCRWLLRALVVVLVLSVVIYLWAAAKFFVFPYEFKGWTEGQIMFNAWTLAQGRNIYVDPMKEPPVAYCYTPGLALLIAPWVRVFGLKLGVGRAVAMVGFFLVLFLVGYAVRRESGSRRWGFLAAGLLLCTYGAMGSHYDDVHPDSWTIVWGLSSLVWAKSAVKNRAWIFPAALAAVFSFFTKQTGISFAIGATIFLLLHRPLRGVMYAVLVGGLIAVGFALGQYLTDGQFWEYTIRAAGEQPLNLWLGLQSFWEFLTVGLSGILALGYCLLDRPRPSLLLGPYALSLPVVIVLYGAGSFRFGGSVSNFYPAMVLALILLGVSLSHLEKTLFQESPRTAFLLLSLVVFQAMMFLGKLPLTPTSDHYRVMKKIEKIVRETPGEVLVFHRISFAFLNGRPVYDNYGVMLDHVNWKDYRRLESQLQRRFFSRVLIPKEAMDMWVVQTSLAKPLRENYDQEEFIVFPSWDLTVPLHVFHRKP